MDRRIEIYQIKEEYQRKYGFRSYEENTKNNTAEIESHWYEKVGEFTTKDDSMTLDDIYEKLNIGERPEGYTGHSLSVSDILVITRDKEEKLPYAFFEDYSDPGKMYSAHYVDRFGFRKLEQDFKCVEASFGNKTVRMPREDFEEMWLSQRGFSSWKELEAELEEERKLEASIKDFQRRERLLAEDMEKESRLQRLEDIVYDKYSVPHPNGTETACCSLDRETVEDMAQALYIVAEWEEEEYDRTFDEFCGFLKNENLGKYAIAHTTTEDEIPDYGYAEINAYIDFKNRAITTEVDDIEVYREENETSEEFCNHLERYTFEDYIEFDKDVFLEQVQQKACDETPLTL